MSNEIVKLLNIWRINPFLEFSISEIMKITHKRTKPWVFNALSSLVKSEILLLRQKGNINLYSLNIENPLSFQLISYLGLQENLDFSQKKAVFEFINVVPVKNYCLLVFGSYAIGEQTKKSDLDLCFLIENREVEKKIKPYLSDVTLNHAISFDVHFITFEEFIQMLLRKDVNVGKEIFNKHKLFYNSDIYYQLLKEGYVHGFRG